MKIRRTFREVTRRVVEAEGRPLDALDQLSLRLHWLACWACRQSRNQARG